MKKRMDDMDKKDMPNTQSQNNLICKDNED